jgi:hypothetical protein
MLNALFDTDPLTGLEPGTPGGETPPSTAGGTPAATEARFMGSHLFETGWRTATKCIARPGAASSNPPCAIASSAPRH